MKRLSKILSLSTVVVLLLPALALAAGGPAKDLIVVADTRVLEPGPMRYFADLYNTNTTLFAVWATVMTAVYGCFLGFLMDFLMSRTGIDLKSRKIIEH